MFGCSEVHFVLGSQGQERRGKCELASCGPKATFSLYIITLTCIILLLMLEGAQQSALFSCIRKPGEGCAGPIPLDFPRHLLPAPPGSRLCGQGNTGGGRDTGPQGPPTPTVVSHVEKAWETSPEGESLQGINVSPWKHK